MPESNPELKLANEFVQHTRHNIFLTGKAGTGKTTFLQQLKLSTPKRVIITAPTGVAAVNAGGVTLHSFFQLPFGPYVPGSEIHQASQEFNREKIDLIKSLDLLIIDEISMVRADLLDCVDEVLRRYRHPEKPFGGVQLLMIGDLYQLAPVVKRDEGAILKEHYASSYFFSSQALAQTPWVAIELTKIYRQSDAAFIDLLNAVREKRLNKALLEQLNERVESDFSPEEGQNFVTLTTHNQSSDTCNQQELAALTTREYRFKASVEQDFPENAYPTDLELVLKKGAQVMFVRNDTPPNVRFFNGKIGTITRITLDEVHVKCPEEEHEIVVEQTTWENIKYTLNPESNAIEKEVVGKFTQFPLRLAWAITIHKSQGLTFEHAIIDAQAAFAHGQVYVALSRCKSFEGMVLSQPIPASAIRVDRVVADFARQMLNSQPSEEKLLAAKIASQQQMLLECFDFQGLAFNLNKVAELLLDRQDQAQGIAFEEDMALSNIQQSVSDEVVEISERFARELHHLFQAQRQAQQLPEEDDRIQERLQKASVYFSEKLEQGIAPWVANSLDDKSVGGKGAKRPKRVMKALSALHFSVTLKLACLKSCLERFSPETYLKAVATAAQSRS